MAGMHNQHLQRVQPQQVQPQDVPTAENSPREHPLPGLDSDEEGVPFVQGNGTPVGISASQAARLEPHQVLEVSPFAELLPTILDGGNLSASR